MSDSKIVADSSNDDSAIIKTRSNATTADGRKIATVECRCVDRVSRVRVSSFLIHQESESELIREMKLIIQKYAIENTPTKKNLDGSNYEVNLGNNESKTRGLFPKNDGGFLAVTFSESKDFKTESGAKRWLAKRGLRPDGYRLDDSAVGSVS